VENMPLEKIIEIGTQVGVKTALETLKKERDEKRKSRYDRRLRNTRLLLREYRKLMIHREESVKSNKRAIASWMNWKMNVSQAVFTSSQSARVRKEQPSL
jgi:hypothetical protein